MPRYLIGLDLGTTNSAAAYVDTSEPLRGGRPTIHRFVVPQVVQPGEVAARETLPSFLYFPTDDESDAGRAVVGVYARDHGGLVPGRQVSSAKSWLCNPAVDRTAPILPWGHAEDAPACSPVEASARYLSHIRDAWNQTHQTAGQRFEEQRIVLTVPASFDQEARELTLEAARTAAFMDVILLEEPLAAFYAWIASHARSFRQALRDGDTILVCDVGGGTTDFTLIRAAFRDDQVAFERTAVGEHLLLGGDNLDLALAKRVQAKLGDVQLTLRQQQALARVASAAKEQLLSDSGAERVTVAIPAAGRAMVGGRLAAELTREEVIETMRQGFLPRVARDDVPARSSRAGLREFGLPYASEPAITRHLAAFLARAAQAASVADLVRPDAILFNGGFFTPEIARDAITATVRSWFTSEGSNWQPKVLANRNPAAAVAVGAAHFAFVREHGGVRVSGGSGRAYYIGVRDAEASSGQSVIAICVMPRGTEEGTTLDLPGRQFTVATNRPVAFPLYSSTVRNDRLGDVVPLEGDEVHAHAPLVTALRYGKKSRHTELPVHLSARFTEVGTLEIWCHSNATEHKWRLQFELRAVEHAVDEDDVEAAAEPEGSTSDAGILIPDSAIEQATTLIREVFGSATGSASPDSIATHIEETFGYARQAWPLAVIRRLADVLLECAEGRRKAARFEARWLNLAGFCLRPGFGATLDKWRMEQLRRVYLAGLVFGNELQGQAEWLVLWQRVAGGLGAGQQQEIYQRYRTVLGVGGRKEVKRLNAQVEREGWRLLASLELLPASTRVTLGNDLIARLTRQPDNPAFLWALGRLGARMASYGPLNTLVPASAAAKWLDTLLARPQLSAEAQAAIVQMAARTGDPHRDIDESLRARVVERLRDAGTNGRDLERLHSYVPPATSDALRLFGETLPAGLRLTTA